ncbi:hypothetical protein GGTG_04702 [Gaeumannomyces tritici R3-111a-1]|uniref:Uncharacterized protein n=1 Tax=Gaeumannomyces tritici (strain R3-111a-1) TaxID=644352 RepID=J3NTV3_GAET3|nr:hypothetical protein GGTG_04702 [Gaeumannomyces tritici R3-111a-1]EJT79618.1 hypothetical protein GGTG_04702 [Gaeumannomyces tritici R3-111a-1]
MPPRSSASSQEVKRSSATHPPRPRTLERSRGRRALLERSRGRRAFLERSRGGELSRGQEVLGHAPSATHPPSMTLLIENRKELLTRSSKIATSVDDFDEQLLAIFDEGQQQQLHLLLLLAQLTKAFWIKNRTNLVRSDNMVILQESLIVAGTLLSTSSFELEIPSYLIGKKHPSPTKLEWEDIKQKWQMEHRQMISTFAKLNMDNVGADMVNMDDVADEVNDNMPGPRRPAQRGVLLSLVLFMHPRVARAAVVVPDHKIPETGRFTHRCRPGSLSCSRTRT